jgi:hypothetical protein
MNILIEFVKKKNCSEFSFARENEGRTIFLKTKKILKTQRFFFVIL